MESNHSERVDMSPEAVTARVRTAATVRLPKLNIEVIDDQMAAFLRAKTPAEKLAMCNGMWRSARRLIEAAVSREHPDWSPLELQREVVRRMSHGAT